VRTPAGRRIQEVVRVNGYSASDGYTIASVEPRLVAVNPDRAA
jgi:hypothetical protein